MAICIGSLAVRIVLVGKVHGPWIFPDELGYEQVAANIARGHLALYGQSGLSYSPLYPLALSPLYALGLSAAHAYEWLKVVNALLMSLSLFPVYGIARFVLPRRPALAVVALCALAPLMYYTTLGMSENLAYPLFLVAAWLLLRTLVDPTKRNDLLLLGAMILACAARIQLVALFPAALTALVLLEAPRARSGPNPLRSILGGVVRQHTVLVVGSLSLAVVAVIPSLAGHSAFSAAGRYSSVPGSGGLQFVHVAKLFVYHAAGLVFVVGVAPFIGTIVAAYVCFRFGAGSRAQAFGAAAVGLTFWLLVETALAVNAFEREGDAPRIHERYLFYLVPLFLTALVAVLRDRRARERPVLYAGATLVAIVAVLAIPFQTVINGTIVADSFSFQIFADNRTLQAISHATVLAAGVVAVIGALLLVLRSHPLIVGIGIAAAFVFMSDRLAVRIAAAANGHRTFIAQRDPGMGRPGSSSDARSHDRRPVDDGSGGRMADRLPQPLDSPALLRLSRHA